jgi:hypothetical protein
MAVLVEGGGGGGGAPNLTTKKCDFVLDQFYFSFNLFSINLNGIRLSVGYLNASTYLQ